MYRVLERRSTKLIRGRKSDRSNLDMRLRTSADVDFTFRLAVGVGVSLGNPTTRMMDTVKEGVRGTSQDFKIYEVTIDSSLELYV